MSIFDNDSSDSLSTMDRLRIEQQGGSVRDLSTGGSVVERPSTSGVSLYDRYDASGSKTDSHTGFAPLW